MRIIADENIPYAERLFSHFGDVQKLPGRKLKPSDVVDADILLLRSVTQVNAALLEKSRVQFVGSATIGTDHIDLNYLSKRGVGFSNAPGCNALAASEYTLAAALALAERQDIDLAGKTAAIIGCGHVGTNVYKKLQALDFHGVIWILEVNKHQLLDPELKIHLSKWVWCLRNPKEEEQSEEAASTRMVCHSRSICC